jgi:hypothetical protein
MISKKGINFKEILTIFSVILILTFSINLFKDIFKEFNLYLTIFLSLSIIIILNVLIKKFVAYLLDSELEMKLWESKKRKLRKKWKEKTVSFPLGIIIPVLSRFLFFAFGNFIWMASLIFEVKPRIYRSAKRYGLYSFSEMSEYHMAIIAALGILMNLFVSLLFYLFGFETSAKLALYYSFFNLLPIGELDGNKIFYGKMLWWAVLSLIVLIGLFFSVLIV